MKLLLNRFVAGVVLLAAALALEGCGSKSAEPGPGTPQANVSQTLPSQANGLTTQQNERKSANDAMRARDAK